MIVIFIKHIEKTMYAIHLIESLFKDDAFLSDLQESRWKSRFTRKRICFKFDTTRIRFGCSPIYIVRFGVLMLISCSCDYCFFRQFNWHWIKIKALRDLKLRLSH